MEVGRPPRARILSGSDVSFPCPGANDLVDDALFHSPQKTLPCQFALDSRITVQERLYVLLRGQKLSH